jgi:hypothetical protein
MRLSFRDYKSPVGGGLTLEKRNYVFGWPGKFITKTTVMGVRRLFSRMGGGWGREGRVGGQEHTFCVKNNKKNILFFSKKSKNILF